MRFSRAPGPRKTGLKGVAGIDRVTILPGKTYLRGWAGYGDPPPLEPESPTAATPPPSSPRRRPRAYRPMWTKDSGPGDVKFADAKALITTATFTTPGAYVLRLTADNGQSKASSTLNVSVETPPPANQLDAVYTKNFKINSPLWNARAKALMVSWIPALHRPDQPHRPHAGARRHRQLRRGRESPARRAARRTQGLRVLQRLGAPDRRGDEHRADDRPAGRSRDHRRRTQKMRATLEDWIPKILAAQEPDGYLQTAFTLPRVDARGKIEPEPVQALGARAAITKATPPATSSNRPSITT